jgi:hypothetical protein
VLAYLARYADKVVTHRMLLAKVWGPVYGNDVQYLRVFTWCTSVWWAGSNRIPIWDTRAKGRGRVAPRSPDPHTSRVSRP